MDWISATTTRLTNSVGFAAASGVGATGGEATKRGLVRRHRRVGPLNETTTPGSTAPSWVK
jgi:hypothetical protein